MEWLANPNVWIGLLTLVLLEIILGIDNLVFIAILSEKLPIYERQRACITGLTCALLMRLVLLGVINWVTTLTQPLFTVMDWEGTGRDIIVISGGIFLLAKGTIELHQRLEWKGKVRETNATRVMFWELIAQIVVLDAVFSLDSIITAIGMVQNVSVMMTAMTVAMGVMMLASAPLMNFVSRHPTIVVLCLGFLMMIGFSLVVEGFGFNIPKGYLYAAIGFSACIEGFNQISRHNREKLIMTNDLRSRIASAVLRLLGGGRGEGTLSDTVAVIAEQAAAAEVFRPEEKQMIRSVLDLAKRPVRSIMSPRYEVEWLNLLGNKHDLRKELQGFKHSCIVLAHNKIDEFLGIAFTKELLLNIAEGKEINWDSVMRQPLVVHENTSVLRIMERLRHSSVQVAIVVDEHGSFEGIVTPIDILEAIAGDFPDDDEESVIMESGEDDSLIVEGYADIRSLGSLLDRDLVDDNDRYTTLAGYMLWKFGHIPIVGEVFEADGFRFEVIKMERCNISKVRIIPLS
ncbi:MAG: Membrane protein [Candidatus Tokpelaia sp. JSC188]|nr:MAG: Membrane protein [Candidatus Tokpelaia sp. JSC188]